MHRGTDNSQYWRTWVVGTRLLGLQLLGVANGVGELFAEDRLVLADLRHQIGLSQHAAADAVGLTASMYGAIETGFRTADPEQRRRLAALYGVTEEKFQVLWQRTRDTRTARIKAR